MINKQSGADQKRLKLSRFLRKKRIEFHKTWTMKQEIIKFLLNVKIRELFLLWKNL
jgi:hypothetical protein